MTYEGAHSIIGPYLKDLGATALQVAIIAGFGEMLAASLRFFSGRFADRTHAYWTITFCGYAMNVIAVPALAFAQTWQAAAILIIAERTGKALRGPARVGTVHLDRSRIRHPPPGMQCCGEWIWLPVSWLFICSSRNVSEWLHYTGDVQTDRYLEGNPLDRVILTALLLFAVLVLVKRGARVVVLLRANFPIALYFLYCGISFIWSDYPDVSFKRWFRAIGDVVMILVVLTDTDWYEALKRFLTRVGFLVIPLSALFIRYFPELGRAYSRAGTATWTGVSTDKNALGIMSALFGLASLYYLLEFYRQPQEGKRRGPLYAYGIVVVTSVYLLYESNSATALSCFLLGGSLMVMTILFPKARNATFLNLAVTVAILVPFSAMFLGIGSGLVENLGRNTTFTGRTAIWHCALPMVGNPIIGEGFESFWLGQRLLDVAKCIDQGLNQAHNGYIEVYLNLGWIGLSLLAVLIVRSNRPYSATSSPGLWNEMPSRCAAASRSTLGSAGCCASAEFAASVAAANKIARSDERFIFHFSSLDRCGTTHPPWTFGRT